MRSSRGVGFVLSPFTPTAAFRRITSSASMLAEDQRLPPRWWRGRIKTSRMMMIIVSQRAIDSRRKMDRSSFAPLRNEFAFRRGNDAASRPRGAPTASGAQYLDRQNRSKGVGRDAVLVEIFGGLLDLDVAGERGERSASQSPSPPSPSHLDHVAGEHHRRRRRPRQ